MRSLFALVTAVALLIVAGLLAAGCPKRTADAPGAGSSLAAPVSVTDKPADDQAGSEVAGRTSGQGRSVDQLI